ncbi:MAG: tetratricopeptide repeat protein [Acidobacteriia bacterium]|nr:tetratricopeptide repeat protein [Terriglobia bacterium]
MWTIYAIVPLLLTVFALVHFFKRGSGNYLWVFLIIFLPTIGPIVYIIVEVLPELRSGPASRASSGWLANRKRIKYLEAVVLDNPSAGNYEELADLYLQDENYARARECFDRAISSRTDLPDPFYGRALCSLVLSDIARATPDLEKAVAMNRKHDYGRALGLLAFCYAQTGKAEAAETLFREALATSTLSETQFRFAEFLAAQGKTDEARDWAQRVVNKRAALSGPLRRADTRWIRQSESLLKQLGG